MADLITNELAPGRLRNESVLPETSLPEWNAAIAEIETIKTLLWQHIAELKSKKEKAIWIEYCLSSCAILSDQLFKYEKDLYPAPEENHIRHYLSGCTRLRQEILALMIFITRHFKQYCNKSLPLPKAAQYLVWKELNECILSFKKLLQEKEFGKQPLELVIGALKDYKGETDGQLFSWRQWSYMLSLNSEIKDLLETGRQYEADTVSNFFTRTNFNELALAEHLFETIRQEIIQVENRDQQLKLWNFYKNKYLFSISAQKQGLHKRLPSLKNIMISMIKEEIKYTIWQWNAVNQAGDIRPAISSPPEIIKTNLSVEALGLFISLLQDAAVIKYKNKKQLVSRIAAACHTLNTTTISPESLLNKSYKPGSAAIKMVKDYLFEMIKVLHDY